MNIKQLVKWSNIVGLVSFILLIYWVFTFILVETFQLKIFRQHMSEMFAWSVLGIIALMAGALMLNIMLNLTRIAERSQENATHQYSKKMLMLWLSIFPILAGLLFAGHYASMQRWKMLLFQSAEHMMQTHPQQMAFIAHYQFTPAYIQQTSASLNVLKKLNNSFQDVAVIVPEQVDGQAVYLHFDADSWTEYTYYHKDQKVEKRQFIQSLHKAERQYLDQIFRQNQRQTYFARHGNDYALYYPYHVNGKTIAVLVLENYSRYGKYGS